MLRQYPASGGAHGTSKRQGRHRDRGGLTDSRADRARNLAERIRSTEGEDILFAATMPRFEPVEAMALCPAANSGLILFTVRPFGRR